jgi:hypothetical protein
MLERTDTEWAPWTIVEATDRRWARAKIFTTLIRRLEDALAQCGFELPPVAPVLGADEGEERDIEDLEAVLDAELMTEAPEGEDAGDD